MIAALILAAGVTAIVIRVIERRAHRLRLVDRPNARSSHVVPRPRGGGLGIVLGSLAGLGVLMAGGLRLPTSLLSVIAAALLVAAAGLWDDLVQLSPRIRLGVQAIGGAFVVAVCGGFATVPLPPPLELALSPATGAVLAVVWMVGVTNFFNFMDGADGLAGGQAVITFGALASVTWPAPGGMLALLTAVSVLAFLTRNWSPARIFLGDVGSGWLGFLLAAVPFSVEADTRSALVLLVATSMALFLIDPAITLIRRLARGARVTESHREHAYQRLFVPGEPHGRVVLALLAAAAAITGVAVWAFQHEQRIWIGLAFAVAAFTAEWLAAASVGRKAAQT